MNTEKEYYGCAIFLIEYVTNIYLVYSATGIIQEHANINILKCTLAISLVYMYKKNS